jgi:hypothetical protein
MIQVPPRPTNTTDRPTPIPPRESDGLLISLPSALSAAAAATAAAAAATTDKFRVEITATVEH